jgi:hypothetical protein
MPTPSAPLTTQSHPASFSINLYTIVSSSCRGFFCDLLNLQIYSAVVFNIQERKSKKMRRDGGKEEEEREEERRRGERRGGEKSGIKER